MWALLVVETNPVRYYPTRMLQCLKPSPVPTLLLDRMNDPLHQTVLLRAMRLDEFLLQVIALDQSGVAIDHHGQTRPAIASRPNAAQVRCPTLIGRLGQRGHGLNTRSKPNWPLLDLAPSNLEDALRRVLVEFEQARHRAVAK